MTAAIQSNIYCDVRVGATRTSPRNESPSSKTAIVIQVRGYGGAGDRKNRLPADDRTHYEIGVTKQFAAILQLKAAGSRSRFARRDVSSGSVCARATASCSRYEWPSRLHERRGPARRGRR